MSELRMQLKITGKCLLNEITVYPFTRYVHIIE